MPEYTTHGSRLGVDGPGSMVNKPYLKYINLGQNFKNTFCLRNVRTDLVVSQSESEYN